MSMLYSSRLSLCRSVHVFRFFSVTMWFYILVFFFKQKTAYEMRISDWSSDVCSSDLEFTIHTDGDIDQVPSDSDKNVPHHHNYCHGHDVGAPARTTMEYTHVLTMPKPTISASASLDGRTGMVHLRPPQA